MRSGGYATWGSRRPQQAERRSTRPPLRAVTAPGGQRHQVTAYSRAVLPMAVAATRPPSGLNLAGLDTESVGPHPRCCTASFGAQGADCSLGLTEQGAPPRTSHFPAGLPFHPPSDHPDDPSAGGCNSETFATTIHLVAPYERCSTAKHEGERTRRTFSPSRRVLVTQSLTPALPAY